MNRIRSKIRWIKFGKSYCVLCETNDKRDVVHTYVNGGWQGKASQGKCDALLEFDPQFSTFGADDVCLLFIIAVEYDGCSPVDNSACACIHIDYATLCTGSLEHSSA